MSVANLKSYNILDAMKPDQKVGNMEEGNDSLDNFIRQAIGKEPVLTFPRAGDSPVQWIQLLQALDYQGTNKFSKNNSVDWKEYQPEHRNGVSSFASEINGIKDSVHPLKSSGVSVRGTKSASEHMQNFKIPEAVVAFAQAAAKANGEPEKYLPGWPLLSPPKVQMQKCDKCAREFCSPINYRRHIRVHRRALNIDKDFSKNRDFLGVFWDKLPLDDAKEIVSFQNITLEEVPGSSIVKTLTSLIRKPGFSSLPQVYVKAGSALLDVVQARPSRFPISSQELFNILDDASEKTFLCAGTALTMQKFVFDGEAGKIGLEMKNIVACTCFLVEQMLLKAWLADKDAKALRCQKLLMEEEEAAQKRQADLLERRRLKKLRQKEQKEAKEQIDRVEADFGENSSDSSTDLPSVEISSPAAASKVYSSILEESSDLEPLRHLNTNEEVDVNCSSGLDQVQFDITSSNVDSNNFRNVDHQMKKGIVRRPQVVTRRPSSSSHRGASNGYHSGAVYPKLSPVQRQGVHRDQKSTSLTNGHKIWTRKTKPDNEGEDLMNVGAFGELRDLNSRVAQDSRDQPDQNKNREVLIGSIPVPLRECNGECQSAMFVVPVDQCAADNQLPQNKNIQEKHVKSDSGQCGTNRSVKFWRPVGNKEPASTAMVKYGERERDTSVVKNIEVADCAPRNEICLPDFSPDDSSGRMGSSTLLEEGANSSGLKLFCSSSAEAFLTQRWKEAIAADHVRLVLSPESERENQGNHLDDTVVGGPLNPNILCSSENRLSNVGLLEPAIHEAPKVKSKGKTGKNGRLKYLPKQRNHT